MNMNKSDILRENQLNAINISIENDFESGIHFHATGTGKSRIAMNIIYEFNKLYPHKNILWICEKKSILISQFNNKNLKKNNYDEFLKKFNVLNFVEYKVNDWYNSVNTSKFWNKPFLLIINRCYLTTQNKYTNIKLPIHLVIHDECHSITNKSTKDFYKYLFDKNYGIIPKCIGFSATPIIEKPFDKILSSYSIYNALNDDIILPPKIKWFSSNDLLNYNEIIELSSNLINNPEIIYKKIIVWCGMIDLCKKMADLFISYFPNFLIAIDTSKDEFKRVSSPCDDFKREKINKNIKNYEDFANCEKNALLFCAGKHREGSDIKNLDCAIFLDKVEVRCSQVFVQCIGRVLRQDPLRKKKYGLIIDVKAKSSYYIINNLNLALFGKSNNIKNVNPWDYKYKLLNYNNKLIKIHTLFMIKKSVNLNANNFIEDYPNINYPNEDLINENYNISIDEFKKLFIRNIPDDINYHNRLNLEINMLYRKNLISHLMKAIEILNITKNIPHITRGSCGSSLVCYVLGISHIDPVLNNIKFARFLTEFRNNLPDIDLDFPHNMRDEVFLKISLKWPGKVARISNHVYYHDKSAFRQAFRNAGIRKFIGKNDINKEFDKLDYNTKEFIIREKKNLEETFRCYSLHCGGIVYFPNGIPDELIIKKNTSNLEMEYPQDFLAQIKMNKIDVAKDKNFKIDILSSRALSQAFEINNYQPINFEDFHFDENTFNMLANGNNIGITLGESPLIRIAFMKIKPKNIYDLAVCLSIIRPAAKDARKTAYEMDTDLNNVIIFDDDAIDIISKNYELSDEEADNYRRGFAKGDKTIIENFRNIIRHLSIEEQKTILKKLSNLNNYGFCKAHAFSYAQLIYKLAYMKANKPYEFWKATLNNCSSS